ncbi:hypothetical protein TNCV_5113011 [Trichonephila clavipes]|nr:hypothetical protein TNCV_5113011 [Trichonephila clavipes]
MVKRAARYIGEKRLKEQQIVQVANVQRNLSLSSRRKKEKFQKLTEFERRIIIGLLEEEFSYRALGARVQWNSSTVMRVWKQWTDE